MAHALPTGSTGVMTEGDETKAICQLIERLVMRFPQVAATTVEETVSAAHREFMDAPVRDFVPLLVEHDVLTRLKELAGQADLGRASQGSEGREVAFGRRP